MIYLRRCIKLRKLNFNIKFKHFTIIFPFVLFIISSGSSYYSNKTSVSGSKFNIVSVYQSYDKNNLNSQNDIAVKFNERVKLGLNYNKIKLLNEKKLVAFSKSLINNILYIHPKIAFSFDKKYSLIIPNNAVLGLNSKEHNAYKAFNLSPDKLIEDNTNDRDDFKTSANEFYNYTVSNYPFLEMSKTITGFDFKANKSNIINKLSMSKDQDEFNANILKVVNKLVPGTHTRPVNMTLYSPKDFDFIYLNGEYVIVNSTNPDIKIGDIVNKINGRNIDDYIKKGDNVLISNFDWNRNKLISNRGVFLSNSDLILTITNLADIENDFNVSMKKIMKNFSLNTQITQLSTYDITTKIIKENETAYVKVPTFNNIDFKKIDEFLKIIQNYKYLIIDVRNNAGGDLNLSRQLMSRITNQPKTITNYICIKSTPIMIDKNKLPYNFYDETELLTKAIKNSSSILPVYVKNNDYTVYKVKINIRPNITRFNGKVYILTNNSCFSATEYFCNTMKRMDAASLVGGYTGGDGILFVPVLKSLLYDLANISYSYTIGIQDDGIINQLEHTKPNYYVEQDKNSYIKYLIQGGNFSDYDTALNECLTLIDKDDNKFKE